MAFEYNGVVYRDLEPQVRYDAEQVQLLKQADVTINESLQTINNEVNGKLTKPANPSAESAVTMLADGTVGTKPLSEIGGGKLYSHYISVEYGDIVGISFFLYTSRKDAYTYDTLPTSTNTYTGEINGTYTGVVKINIISKKIQASEYEIHLSIDGVIYSVQDSLIQRLSQERVPQQVIKFTDTVTEL